MKIRINTITEKYQKYAYAKADNGIFVYIPTGLVPYLREGDLIEVNVMKNGIYIAESLLERGSVVMKY